MNAILITSTLLIIFAIVLVVASHLIGIFWYLKKTGDNLEKLFNSKAKQCKVLNGDTATENALKNLSSNP